MANASTLLGFATATMTATTGAMNKIVTDKQPLLLALLE